MSLPTTIKDGEGLGFSAGVTPEHALKVTIVERKAVDFSAEDLEALTNRKQFRGFATTVAGSKDLNIDASVTPTTFSLVSSASVVYWVTQVRFLFNGTNLEMDSGDFRRFGAATAVNTPLTNGVTFFASQGGVRTDFFTPAITRMGDLYDWVDEFLNIKNSISSSSDFLSFDYRFDVPVVLVPGSSDVLTIRIADNLSALERFNVLVRGYQETL